MDSPSGPTPGSLPLRNYQHELFAQARAITLPLLEAARHAGYTTMTAGNAAKVDRLTRVRERVKFLAGNTEEVIRKKRERVEGELNTLAYASMADYVVIDDNGMPHLDLTGWQGLPEELRRPALAAVKSITYTEHGPRFELHSKDGALAQLRKLNGLDEPDKLDHRLSGPGGRGPVEFRDMTDQKRARALAAFVARTKTRAGSKAA